MNKTLFFCCIVLLFSCNDGDLPIETIDFDNVDPQMCNEVQPEVVNVLFKINTDEALILELPSGVLKNQITESDIISVVPGASKITYRIFSGNVTKDYFCSEIPVTEPTVTQEIAAESGEVLISTTTKDSITYEHVIRLDNISFRTGSDTRITDLTINDFGTVTTKVIIN